MDKDTLMKLAKVLKEDIGIAILEDSEIIVDENDEMVLDWLIKQAEKAERYEKALQTIMKDSELVNGIHGKTSYSYPGKVAKKALEG